MPTGQQRFHLFTQVFFYLHVVLGESEFWPNKSAKKVTDKKRKKKKRSPASAEDVCQWVRVCISAGDPLPCRVNLLWEGRAAGWRILQQLPQPSPHTAARHARLGSAQISRLYHGSTTQLSTY